MRHNLESLYAALANEEDARACTDIPDTACAEVPGNFFKLLLSQWLSKTGDALASTKLVLPWLLASLGAPAFFAGLLVPIRESGSLLPQLFIGGWVRSYRIRKTFFVLGSLVQGVIVLAMALVALTLHGATAGWSIVGLLVLFSLARGLCSVASKDVLGKTIPKTRRGLLNGYSASGAGVITLVLGAVLVLPWQKGDFDVAYYLLAAAAAWGVAAVLYAAVIETPGATDGGGNAIKQALHNLTLLRSDLPFRRFVIARALLVGSGLSAPYFVLMASGNGEGDLVNLGYLLLVSGGAEFVSGPFWGKFADRSSRRLMMVCAAAISVLCFTGAAVNMSDPGIVAVLLLYFISSVVHQGVRLGRKTYVVDLAGGNRRTDYVSVSNSLIGIVLIMAGGLSAALAHTSVTAALVLFAAMGACAAALIWQLPEVDA
ncbi:MFS transporter [Teredinibacter turnerae]|uniref:MFS transporter n=1 Tax=Teredinibacter turnerae TaxID=2426 RepID=UPI00037EBB9B|nr:MFS transporter [Teredinibacter turnerae]